nr:unnamed protein product [Callosobruchus analis]
MGAAEFAINILKGYVTGFLERSPFTLLRQNTMAKSETTGSPRMNEEMRKPIDQKVVVELQTVTGFLSKMFLNTKPEGQGKPVVILKRQNVAPKKTTSPESSQITIVPSGKDYLAKTLALPENHLCHDNTSLRTKLCTSSVCRDYKLGCKSTEVAKSTNSRIPRRYFNRKLKLGRVKKGGTGSNEYSYEIGFPGEPHKISIDAHTGSRLLGPYMEYPKESEKSTGRQNLQTEEIVTMIQNQNWSWKQTKSLLGENGIHLL